MFDRDTLTGHPRFKQLTEEEIKIHNEKNGDYAGHGNPLGNFVRVAQILSLYPGLDLSNPAVVAMVYSMKQIDAILWMLSQGYDGKVETVGNKLMDVSIYAKLARILHEEKQK